MKLTLLEKIPQRHRRRTWLTRYIRKTPVGWLHILLEHGCPYWRATISEIHNLKTIFNYSNKDKRKRTLQASRSLVRTKRHKDKLRQYRAMLQNGEPLEVVITVVHTKRGIIIADGNHRAIASFLVGKRELAVEYVDIRWPA